MPSVTTDFRFTSGQRRMIQQHYEENRGKSAADLAAWLLKEHGIKTARGTMYRVITTRVDPSAPDSQKNRSSRRYKAAEDHLSKWMDECDHAVDGNTITFVPAATT